MRRLLGIILFVFTALVPACAQAEAALSLEPLISPNTRLMIISPHPDDESLGAAGLIQRVLQRGGRVKVVFLTNGDGFPKGLGNGEPVSHPTAQDYRQYGAERRLEAISALSTLGLQESDLIFLGFPDGGLASLRSQFFSGPLAYRSPFSLEDRPPATAIAISQTRFTGQDLTREIARVIVDFRPNLLVTTPPQDEHPDHSSAYFFVKGALTRAGKIYPHLKPQILTFLIHFGRWPICQGAGNGSRLDPPQDFPHIKIKWVSLALYPEEMVTKRRAILEYHSQVIAIGRYLLSFTRSNELFIKED